MALRVKCRRPGEGPAMQLTTSPETPAEAADGAHAVFEVLRAWGVDLIFTCPGSTEAAVLDASVDFPKVRTILVTHEAIAVAAADGYTRASGKPAVAYLHANVGLANGASMLSCAAQTNSPVVVLNGMKSTVIGNRGGFTTAPYQQDYIRQHVRLGRIALRSDGIPEDLVRALKAATADPGGPVYLGLPQDLVEAQAPVALPDVARRRVSSKRRPDQAAVDAAARLFTEASAVTIVAGREIATRSARAALLTLAERLDAAIVLEDRRTMTANGITGDHPHAAGVFALTNPAVADADVIFLAGMPSFAEFEAGTAPVIPRDKKVVHLCSDPEEIAKLDGVDVGLTGNAALALRDLASAVGYVSSETRRAHREKACSDYRDATWNRRMMMRARYDESPIHPAVLMEALHDALPNDCVVVSDAVTSGGYLTDAILPGTSREFLTNGGGSLGWGMGAALGVQLAQPGARVVCVIGDGVFQFGIQALWTAVACKLPVTFVVVDNASYAAVKAALKRYRSRTGAHDHGTYPASELQGPDIAAIARGFGAYGETVDQLSDLRASIERAFACDGPAVIVVKTDRTHTGP
jgi:thiamine pyrophosphate-dependent acetolactate synthase large subunit-like protein